MRPSPSLLLSLLATAALSAAAQAPAGSDYVIRNFKFESGETLPELRLHYIALGKPRKDATGKVRNAVVINHGTGGTGGAFMSRTFGGELFGPGQLLDTAKYYVILQDGIGHGKSSKPSDGLHAKFPRHGYGDMVEADYRLLTDGLKVNHLRLVMAPRWAACTRGCGARPTRTSWTRCCRWRACRRRSAGEIGSGGG